ncbi:hypothetical protein WMY93_016574 [Mugilogobius chulae]|uniref:Uncharacterized protein n=1 Tax=Mugilogobius chulae TaxID=88201 RepID=A0AAW0NQN4_9GOBI
MGKPKAWAFGDHSLTVSVSDFAPTPGPMICPGKERRLERSGAVGWLYVTRKTISYKRHFLRSTIMTEAETEYSDQRVILATVKKKHNQKEDEVSDPSDCCLQVYRVTFHLTPLAPRPRPGRKHT